MEQLRMIKTDGCRADDSLPEGYTFATHRREYAERWIELIKEAIGLDWTYEIFKEKMLSRDYIDPEGIFYVLRGESEIIATATGVTYRKEKIGELHMVVIAPEYRGKGLAFPLSAKAVNYMYDAGMEKIRLKTDEFRVSAIKTYLKLGFIPLLIDETMAGRWKAMAPVVGRTEIPAMEGEWIITTAGTRG